MPSRAQVHPTVRVIRSELTGAQRSSLDYLLENIVDPGRDGRHRLPHVHDRPGRRSAPQRHRRQADRAHADRADPHGTLVVSRTDVEAIRDSELSLMPEGLIDTLTEKEVRDLIAYLMSPQQVPLQ